MEVMMSLAQKDFLRTAATFAAPFALAFGLALNANEAFAAEGQPVEPKTCFVSDADGPANAKLNAAMKGREQKILITGNRAYPKYDSNGKPTFEEGYALNIFTSNEFGTEGYNIESNSPAGQVGSEYCVRAKYSDVRLYNAYKGGVPEDLRKLGGLGQELANTDRHGLRVMMSAKVGNAVMVVQGNLHDPYRLGALTAANATGDKSGTLANMRDVDYTPRAKQALGIPEKVASLAP
jgi:hypothetical protein